MFLLSRLDDKSRLFPEDVEGIREFLLDRGNYLAHGLHAAGALPGNNGVNSSAQLIVGELLRQILLNYLFLSQLSLGALGVATLHV